MNSSVATTLQEGVQQELARRFDHDDSAMAEYIVVMLQNGKDAPAVTEELNDLISNYDASFTNWVFEQVSRLQSGQPISMQEAESGGTADGHAEADTDMEMDGSKDAQKADEPGMGYPSARLYSGLKKTLQDNGSDSKTRHRPENNSVRSTPYGTVAVGNGAMRIPTGPRADGAQGKSSSSGPVRTSRGRSDRSNGSSRQNRSEFPEMPQFPGFPMPPAEFFANMPTMEAMSGMNGLPVVRAPTRRCTKWPTCFKGKSCTFGHPTSICQNPTCRKTDGTCPSVHTDEDVDLQSGIEAQRLTEEEREAKAAARINRHSKPASNGFHKADAFVVDKDASVPVCKFGESCTNRSCHFAHPSPASKNGSSVVLNSKFCQAAMECKDENCSYSHPSPSNKYTPGVKLNTVAAEIACKFNPCLNPTCRFQHSAGQKGQAPPFGGARNKVWTPNSAKTTAERSFVSGEAEEQFNPDSNVHDNDTEMEK